MKRVIYINASDVASACGLNPYKSPQQLISKKETNKICYKNLISKCVDISQESCADIRSATMKCAPHANKELLKEYNLLKQSKDGSRKESDPNKQYINKEIELATKVCLSACIESNDMAMVNATANCLKRALPKELCSGVNNVGRGMHHESADFAKINIEKKYKRPSGIRYAKVCSGTINSIDYNIKIGGICDGLSDDRILELKRRRYRLFYKIKEYEKIQCFAYMYIYNRKQCDLVETYGEEQKIYCIAWDDFYWNSVLIPYLRKFAKLKIIGTSS